MPVDQRAQLIVYGDFNCPFSALASARVGYLERHGLADVDWRAVEHAPDIPSHGRDLIAATPAVDRPRLRNHLFGAYWASGANLSDPETLTRLGAINEDEPTAAQWRDEWLMLPRTIVPIMVLPDSYVSRGLGALTRLAELATTRTRDEMPSNASAAAGAPTAPRTDQLPHPKTPPCCDN